MEVCQAAWVISLLCLIASLTRVVGQSQYGSHFIVAFPFGPTGQTRGNDFRLVLSNPGTSSIVITLQRQGQTVNSYDVGPQSTSLISPLSGADYMLPENGTSTRTVVLKSPTVKDVFGVLVLGSPAYDGYLAIPVSNWGARYTAATVCQGVDSVCQIIVLAKEDNTAVEVTIPSEDQGFSVNEPGRSYAGESKVTNILMQNEAWIIQRPYEMSGARIISSSGVGVLAGAQWTTYKGSNGTVVEQLPPLKTLGQEYVSVGVGTIRIVTTEPMTTAYFSHSSPVRLKTAGQWHQAYCVQPVHFRADRPVLAVEFGLLAKSELSGKSYPVLVVLSPVRQFLGSGSYTLVPPVQNGTQNLLLVTREKSQDLILYNALQISKESSKRTLVLGTDYYLFEVDSSGPDPASVSQGPNASVQDVLMAPYLQAKSGEGDFMAPLGVFYNDLNPDKDCKLTTPQKSGDTVDNDCDGMVDEDDCSAGGQGIDCRSEDSDSLTTWGKSFVTVVPEHLKNVTISLALSTLSSSEVQVLINQTEGKTITKTLSGSLDPQSVDLSGMSEFSRAATASPQVVRASSDQNFSVTVHISGTTAGFSLAGSMRLIPERALGKEYYVVTICSSTERCVFQVASIYPDTKLEIYLKLDPAEASSTVNVLGASYSHGDVIRMDMGEYEALELNCSAGCNMIGSLVTASKPVAVFVLSAVTYYTQPYDKDIFVEQMPPVESYGRNFIISQQPDRFKQENYCQLVTDGCEDVVFIVASEVNSTIKVATKGNSTVSEYQLQAAGQVLQLRMKNEIMQIVSQRAILVTQVLMSLIENDGALMVVPPVSQYQDHDINLFLDQTPCPDWQIVVYTISSMELLIDRSLKNFDGLVTGPFYNVSYLVINFTTPSAVSAELQATNSGLFGGYVSNLGKSESVTSLAYGLQRNNTACTLTKANRADGTDNDCDGIVDEEPCLIGTAQDADGDGRYDEDCQALPEVTTTEPPATTTQDQTTQPETTIQPVTTSNLTTESHDTAVSLSSHASPPSDDVTTATTPSDDDTTATTPSDDDTTATTPSDDITTASQPSDDVTTATTPFNGVTTVTTSSYDVTPSLPDVRNSASSQSFSNPPIVTSSQSLTVNPRSTIRSALCGCACTRADVNSTVASDSLSSILSSIVSELSVKKSELSSVRRKKSSAEDNRTSAQTVGYFGVAIIIGVGVGIVVLDSGALYRDLRNLIISCKSR